jgi:phospholipid transport system substrate-binding protein
VRIRVAAVGKPNEDGDVLVVTDGEMAGKPSVKLEIRVRRYADQSLRIIDIAVEGISMAVTQRDEFSSVIQRGGGQVQALIAALRERTTTP